MSRWRPWIVVAVIGIVTVALAQSVRARQKLAAATPSSARVAPVPHFPALASIPVPYDPLEAVTSDAQLVQTPEDRAAAITLLTRAHHLSNIRLHPYDLKTSFVSYGSSTSDGPWILEDTSPGAAIYRWTAQGPSFFGVFLAADRLVSSNQPGGAMPLRLAQVRGAMWDVYRVIDPHSTLRVANGNLGGAELRCVLIGPAYFGMAKPEFSSGRSFDEAEYCVDMQTGLLETYSPWAGVFIRYDYSNGFHFHDLIIPNGFTITERGKTVIEAKTESVGEAPPPNSNLFQPSGLNPLGVGQAIVGPMRVESFHSSDSLDAGAPEQVVVLHGMVSPEGRLSEVELLATTNESLDQAAFDYADKAHALQMGGSVQPGTTPQSREVVFTIHFTPRPKSGADGPFSSAAPN